MNCKKCGHPVSLDSPETLLKMDETAAMFGISVKSLYSMRSRGRGPQGIRVGKRVMFRPSKINEWLEAHEDDWTDDVA